MKIVTHLAKGITKQIAFKKVFNEWDIKGNMGLSVNVVKQQNPPYGVSGVPAWYAKDYDLVANHFQQLSVPEKAAAVVLGIGIAILALPEEVFILGAGAIIVATTT